jgi:hypothetical protein
MDGIDLLPDRSLIRKVCVHVYLCMFVMFLYGVCVFYDLFHIPFVFVTHLWIHGMCIYNVM